MYLKLVSPHEELVGSFLEALNEGQFIGMQLGHGDVPASEIAANPARYIARINSKEPIFWTMNSKEYAVRSHELLWITDGTRFLGTVALRYDGDTALIEDFAGHIGMAIRPALLNKGYGPRTIKAMYDDILQRFQSRGFHTITATCDPDNAASSRLIQHFGGVLVATSSDVHGTGPNLKYEIAVPK